YNLLENPFSQVRESLIEDAFVATYSISIEEYTSNTFDFSLRAPEGSTVEGIEINRTAVSDEEITIEGEANEETLHVQLVATFILDEEYDGLDLFQPAEWSWALEQENEESEEITPEPPVGEDSNSEKEVTVSEKNRESTDEVAGDTEETDESRESTDGVAGDTEETDENRESTDEVDGDRGKADENEESLAEEDDDGAEEKPVPDVKEDEPEKHDDKKPESPITPTDTLTTIYQYNWNQSVQSVLYDQEDFTKALITETAQMYEAIHSLNTLYELYFGLQLSEENAGLEERDLRDIAIEESLYYLVHKKV